MVLTGLIIYLISLRPLEQMAVSSIQKAADLDAFTPVVLVVLSLPELHDLAHTKQELRGKQTHPWFAIIELLATGGCFFSTI